MKFQNKLAKAILRNNSLLCVGLDPDPKKGVKKIFEFNKKIINHTSNVVCAYKPNIAFYEAQGIDSLIELKKTIEYLKKQYPQIPIILDAKRADIPNTAKMYAKSVFDYWQVDAVTVYPNLGLDSITPFLEYKDKLTILLIKTSNEDSSTFQNLNVNGKPYYQQMAEIIKKWDIENIGIFVGATFPKELKNLRNIFPNKIFLSAGIGAQKAQLRAAVKAGIDKNGQGIIFNASRSIIYDHDPKKAAKKLRDEINKYRH